MENLFEGNNWDTTRETLLDGLDGNKRDVMSTVLENTKQALTESSAAGSTTAGNMATLNKVILPIIRRVMPTVIANEIIGVQPMTGPVGQIHSLRVRYAETTGGATAGSEALSPFDIANAYSGDTAGAPAATASMEGAGGNKPLNVGQEIGIRGARCRNNAPSGNRAKKTGIYPARPGTTITGWIQRWRLLESKKFEAPRS